MRDDLLLSALRDISWGYTREIDVFDDDAFDEVTVPVEWVEKDVYPDEGPSDPDGDYSLWTHPIWAVCKVNVNGVDRYFKREGYVKSHEGEYWDNAIVEVIYYTETITKFTAKPIVRDNLTSEEVTNALEGEVRYGVDWDSVGYAPAKSIKIGGVEHPIEILEYEGGEEGDWSIDTRVVFKVGSQVFRKTGHYQSHYGNDWDGPLQEVVATPKTITVWEVK